MSASGESNGRPTIPQETQGVLSNLPRTRPQRSTPRRTAARSANALAREAEAAAGEAAGDAAPTTSTAEARRPAPSRPRSTGAAKASVSSAPKKAKTPRVKAGAGARTGARAGAPRGRNAARRAPSRVRPEGTVPSQGFESEGDRASGPVHPPSGAEIVSSAAEILGELAKAGLATGERLLKDVLSRVPLS